MIVLVYILMIKNKNHDVYVCVLKGECRSSAKCDETKANQTRA